MCTHTCMVQGDLALYEDTTAYVSDSPESRLPREFTAQECSMEHDDLTVYADDIACINDSPKSNFEHNIPDEFTQQEYDALFHEYLCSIAPPVVKATIPDQLQGA
eukprot:gnl/MRDRNA2_/MRDRNA2_28958_c0_seq1.p1 gnl/MRDRNA2_/MRDRNA2_28958_c0~~gnl/MRDRNA2_/MRDRNA2_28958_c0_seq1.p1  ORF type:complete len:105 (+),score=17.65 gnl/MRDRNA2_/MRDRNA2_28958_c0_seq1:104-418(+)